MKGFTLDWVDFIVRLEVWSTLDPATRRIFTTLKSGDRVPARRFGDDAGLLAEAGFIEIQSTGNAALSRAAYPFAAAIRAMARHDVLGDADTSTLAAYLADHFTAEERAAFVPDPSRYGPSDHATARSAASAAWVRDFLALEGAAQAREWEDRRTGRTRHWGRSTSDRLLADPAVLEATQSLVRALAEAGGRLAFQALPWRFPELAPERLAAAIHAAVRYLLAFPVLEGDDLVPALTLWPAAAERLAAPEPAPPAAVTPEQSFHGAFLMEDMTTVLVGAAAEPLRVRKNDNALFARAQQQLEAGLAPLPEWLTRVIQYSPGARLVLAHEFLTGMELVEVRGGEQPRLQGTARAAEWLALPARERLGRILDRLRKDAARKEKPTRRSYYYDEPDPKRSRPPFVPAGHLGPLAHAPEVVDGLARAFAELPDDGFVRLHDFLAHRARTANPLAALAEDRDQEVEFRHWTGWGWRTPTEEELEALWRVVLERILIDRLVPLGGARIGVAPDGTPGVALTGIGRYLLGLADDFDYGDAREAEANVVVQPNFDIVFLAPAPMAEAAIGRFAERKGRGGVGVLFVLTKRSALAAAGAGLTAGQAIETLRSLSRSGLPANVEREIEGWFAQCRRVAFRPAVLIECPDPETAARVLAAGGKLVAPVSDTVVELREPKQRTALLRKLAAAGVFVGGGG